MFAAKCLFNEDLEWLLEVDKEYEVISWTKNSIIIMHDKYGFFGLERKNFQFDEPTENLLSEWDDFSGQFRYKCMVH